MNMFNRSATFVFGASLLLGPVAAQAGGTVEVLHWWTSGGEAKAVGELKKTFEAQGGKWIDSPIAGCYHRVPVLRMRACSPRLFAHPRGGHYGFKNSPLGPLTHTGGRLLAGRAGATR